jgi:glucose/arabinose dehydrogenase
MDKLKQIACLMLLSCVTACGGGSSGGSSVNPPPPNLPPTPPPTGISIQTQQVFSNLSFNNPVVLVQAPGDTRRWFVTEQAGAVRVFDNDVNVASSSTFVDISSRVACCGEMGLLGMAFHPDFANNGEVFLSYTQAGPISYVSRFVSLDGGNTLDSSSEQPLIVMPQDFGNHNGGNIAFGPDGFLYIGFGDGGSANDPNNRAQDNSNLLGAMIRIDVDGGVPYSVPPDNPFAGGPLCSQGFGAGQCPEIYAFGLRNPWRWSFDSQNGDLWLGDVGQGAWEEVDIIVAGGNYGWRLREGAHCNPNRNDPNCNDTILIDPVAEYSHSIGRSITGGYVYRGRDVANLPGSYVFADFGSGRLFRAFTIGQGGFISEELLNTGFAISSFAEDENAELYFLDYGAGRIYRIVDGN